MTEAKIEFVFLESQRRGDTYRLSNELEMGKYSAIIAVGGDGTFHEVINGMLMRKDSARLPIGFLQNGSANDTNTSFGVRDLGLALDFIVKGDTMKMDMVKCILDYET